MALSGVLHRDDLSLPARNGLQLALVTIGDTVRAAHLGGEGESQGLLESNWRAWHLLLALPAYGRAHLGGPGL